MNYLPCYKIFLGGLHIMKTLIIALGIVLLIGSTSFAGWYVMPTVVQAYYPGVPVYAYPPAVVAAPAPYVSYMPVAAPAPYVSYMPAAPAPYACGAYGVPVVAPAPVVIGPAAVVRARVFYPGQPVRNVLKAVVP
jgi:hypothetical protein